MPKRIYNKPIHLRLPGHKDAIVIDNPSGAVLQLIKQMGHGNCSPAESRTIRDMARDLNTRVTNKAYWKANRKKKPLRECDKMFLAAAKFAGDNSMTPTEAMQIFKQCGWSSKNPTALPVRRVEVDDTPVMQPVAPVKSQAELDIEARAKVSAELDREADIRSGYTTQDD